MQEQWRQQRQGAQRSGVALLSQGHMPGQQVRWSWGGWGGWKALQVVWGAACCC